MEKICLVYTTASNKKEAVKIGEKIVGMRLAACVNIFDGVSSCYWWEGKQEKTKEAVLVLKTRRALLPKIEKAIKKLHSYSCPCIVALPAVYVSRDYAKWVERETK